MLQRAYSANKQTHVAFVDESYLPPSRDLPQTPFYVATAYVAPCVDHTGIREDLRDIVGGDFWHTTEAHRSVEQRPIVEELCRYVGEGGGDEHVVVALKKPILANDPDGETARSQCLTELFSALQDGTASPAVTLVIYEERKYQTQRNADARTITKARADGALDRHFVAFAGSPSYETLLWVPDVISFAVYHRETNSVFKYLDPFESKVQYLTA